MESGPAWEGSSVSSAKDQTAGRVAHEEVAHAGGVRRRARHAVGRRLRRRQLVSVQDRGVGEGVRYGEQAPYDGIHAARKGVAEMEDLRLLPAHEGRLLAGGRLRRDRRGQAHGRRDAGARGRRLYRAQQAAQPDRELRRRRRAGGHHRRDLVRRHEQPGRPARRQEDPGDRRHQRHVLGQAVGQVAGLVRRNGRQGRRIPGQAASEGRRRRRRSRGSPDRRAPAGSRPAIPASPRR